MKITVLLIRTVPRQLQGMSFCVVSVSYTHLDVYKRQSHPGAVVGPKGWAVRPLKRYASWVQNVVRQFGPYPAWAQDI